MQTLSFKRHRFPPEIIRHSVWLYARFTLSFGDVEEMLAERGIDVSLLDGPSLVGEARSRDRGQSSARAAIADLL